MEKVVGRIREWIERRGYERWFTRDNLIILVLGGVLLFIIALPTRGAKEELEDGALFGTTPSVGQGDVIESGENVGGIGFSQAEYAAYLEEKLEKILSGMDGVGKVEVMITLSSTEELVVVKDSASEGTQTDETDSEGGSRSILQTNRTETTVYRSSGNDREPYVAKTILPSVEGVVVVAEGAGNGTMDKSITEVVQALFDVGMHKIKVVKMR
ncbi:MAG: hypothetical protein NC417_09800 [Candidatus Gastranaerophilales bacterium]|nr:hypothetical protein [Candidatus Gastranaerophilales bacterium]